MTGTDLSNVVARIKGSVQSAVNKIAAMVASTATGSAVDPATQQAINDAVNELNLLADQLDKIDTAPATVSVASSAKATSLMIASGAQGASVAFLSVDNGAGFTAGEQVNVNVSPAPSSDFNGPHTLTSASSTRLAFATTAPAQGDTPVTGTVTAI